jgi:hypothetical protein
MPNNIVVSQKGQQLLGLEGDLLVYTKQIFIFRQEVANCCSHLFRKSPFIFFFEVDCQKDRKTASVRGQGLKSNILTKC